MRPPFRLLAGCALATALLGLAPALAQSKAEKKASASQRASSSKDASSKARAAKSVKSKGADSTATLPSAASAALASRPAPSQSRAETEHAARYDAAIARVRGLSVSDSDAASIRDAIRAVAAGKPARAKALRAQVQDPAGAKLIEWYSYRAGHGTAGEIRAFLAANPSWPDRGTLTRRAEEALLEGDAGPGEIRAFFTDTTPTTALGFAALAAALAADKTNEPAAKALAAKLWTEVEIPAADEDDVLKRIGTLLTEADHKRRLDGQLQGGGSAKQRKARAASIRRTIARLSEPERKKAEARLAAFVRAKGSSQPVGKLPPAALAKAWELAVERAKAQPAKSKDQEAWAKLLASETEPTQAVRPDGWWEERRGDIYEALRAGKAKAAYALAADPGKLDVNDHNDACFMAGWIALRHLKDAKQALTHFQALVRSADGPLSRARGNYWLGRAYEALGDGSKANEAYLAASLQIDTFHGQLARLKLDPKATSFKIDPPLAPTTEEVERFNSLDTVRAAVIAEKAGVDRAVVRAFLLQVRSHMRTEAEVAMLAHLAEALGDTQIAVRIGKHGVARGFNVIYYAYPVHRLPPYTPLRQPAETAVILGIARQESEFNTLTMSHAGARGILQVMPGTARHICRQYKVKCDIGRLMKDASYNTMLGSAYISDRVDEFDGSYILAIAGYNAGPGRARQWIREFGDPRDPGIDPVDWIHRIPIQETREYVQKVLSNIQVYRARLGNEATAVQLNKDLRRVAVDTTSTTAASAAD